MARLPLDAAPAAGARVRGRRARGCVALLASSLLVACSGWGASFAPSVWRGPRPRAAARGPCRGRVGRRPRRTAAEAGLARADEVNPFDFREQGRLDPDELVYRALTKIRLRREAHVDSPVLQEGDWFGVLEPGDCFEVKGIVRDEQVNARSFLKLFGEDGWAFTLGTAGTWAYQPIVEQVPKDELVQARASALAGIARRQAARLAARAKLTAGEFASLGASFFGKASEAKSREEADNKRREEAYKFKVKRLRDRQQQEVQKDLDGLF